MTHKGAQGAGRSVKYTAWRWDRTSRSLLGVLLYFLLVLVLPGLHISFHIDDHDHRGGGQHHVTPAVLLPSHATGEPHSHGAGTRHTHAPVATDGRGISAAAPDRHAAVVPGQSGAPSAPDLLHGAGSLAHFASSLLPGSAHIDLPLAGLLSGETVSLDPPFVLPRSTLLSSLHARAPPLTLAS